MPTNQSSEDWATLKEDRHRSITALYMDENKTLQEGMQPTRAEHQFSSTQEIIEDNIEDESRRRNANYNRFLKTPQYIDWLDASKLSDRNGILWIIGKPGATKPTLLHFLLQTCRAKKEGIILSFKFDRYGDDELEMSAECFYRSLISQLLEARPGVQDVLDAIRAEQPWDFRSLRSLLGLAIRLLGNTSLICFIDALDECKEAEIWEALEFLQQTCKQAASAGTVVRVCVASRPRLLDYMIEQDTESSHDDINYYISAALRIGNGQLKKIIQNEIKERSLGNITRAAHLVGWLNEEFKKERSQDILCYRLRKTNINFVQLSRFPDFSPISLAKGNANQLRWRARTRKSRVRTCCNNCNIMRIKCDRKRPECTQCVRSKKQCIGYYHLLRHTKSNGKDMTSNPELNIYAGNMINEDTDTIPSHTAHGTVSYSSQTKECMIDDDNDNDGIPIEHTKAAGHSYMRTKSYVDVTAEDLFAKIGGNQLNARTIEKLSCSLPMLLKALALRIGYESRAQSQHDMMLFIYKQSRAIANAFKRCNKNLSHELPTLREQEPTEVMERWLSSTDELNLGKFRAESPENDSEASNHGGCEDKLGLLLPNLEKYRRLIIQNPGYMWMLARLRREIPLTIFEHDALHQIKDTIEWATIHNKDFNQDEPPEEVQVTFTVEWDIMLYFRHQDYDRPDFEAIADCVTLTGTRTYAQALTCRQYMEQVWPVTGLQTLRLIQETLKATQHKKALIFENPCRLNLEAFIINDLVVVEASGLRDFVVEIGEQLAWLSSALRPPQPTLLPDTGICICTPYVDHTIEVPSEGDQLKVTCVISCSLELYHPTAKILNGQCWSYLFSNPVIVRGFPILQRTELDNGLEMPLELMTTMTGTRYLNTFSSNIFIKGFNTMLVPVKQSGDTLVWHLLHSDNPSERISYLTSVHKCDNITMTDLAKFRHVLGWCAEANSIVGTTHAIYKIERSHLPRVHSHHMLEKVEISAGQFVTGTAAFTLGNREKPIHISRFGFLTKLQWISSKHVVLWDEEDKRGWLVNGASALLHILRASLAYSKRKFQSEWLLDPSALGDCEDLSRPDACLQVLINKKNRNLTLYLDKTEVYEENTRDGATTNNISRMQTRHYRLEDKIEHIYNTLEKLIDHQADIERRSGLQITVRPRRQLEGWDFNDLVKDGDPIFARVSTLPTIGKGWIDFTRAIHAVTLFGKGFGELIQPRQTKTILCRQWSLLPKGNYYLATCMSNLIDIMEDDGDSTSNPRRLCENIIWHMKQATFDPCPCLKNAGHSHHDPVQALFPLRFIKNLKKKPQVDLKDAGAVIFGHNMSLHWHWRDAGDPVKGDPPPEPMTTTEIFEDSGIGSSICSSKFPSTPDSGSSKSIGDKSPTPHRFDIPTSPQDMSTEGSKRVLHGLISSASKKLKR